MYELRCPGIKQIATYAGVSEDTVNKALMELEGFGWAFVTVGKGMTPLWCPSQNRYKELREFAMGVRPLPRPMEVMAEAAEPEQIHSRDAQFLRYNIDNIMDDLVQIERHAESMRAVDAPQHLSCILKHLSDIHGESQEGMGHSSTIAPEKIPLFRQLAEKADELRTTLRSKVLPQDELIRRIRSVKALFVQLDPTYDTTECRTCGPMGELIKESPDVKGGMAFPDYNSPGFIDQVMEADRMQYKMNNERIQGMVHGLVKMVADKYGIPTPKVRFAPCPADETTSCTLIDPTRPTQTAMIFYNPKQFSVRTVLHETYHILATAIPEKMRALGLGFTGDPDSEDEANKFAYHEIDLLFPKERINKEASPQTPGITMPDSIPGVPESDLKVMKQVLYAPERVVSGEGAFAGLEPLYGWLEGMVRLDKKTLNEVWSPELIGTAQEILQSSILTPMGNFIASILSSLLLQGIGLAPGVSAYDRMFLNEWAAHSGTRIFRYAIPAEGAALAAYARTAGEQVGQGRYMEAFKQVVRPYEEVAGGFRQGVDQVQRIFEPLLRGGAAAGAQAPRTGEVPPPALRKQDAFV